MGNLNENICSCSEDSKQRTSFNINPNINEIIPNKDYFDNQDQDHDMGDNCLYLNNQYNFKQNTKNSPHINIKRQLTFGQDNNEDMGIEKYEKEKRNMNNSNIISDKVKYM